MTGHVYPKDHSTSDLAKRLMIGRDLPTYKHVDYSGQKQQLFSVDDLNYESEDPFGVSLETYPTGFVWR